MESANKYIIFEHSPEGILNSLGTTSAPQIVTCNSPKFNELRYFTKITALTRYNNFHFSQAKFPPSLRTIDYYTSSWGYLPIIDFPSSLTTIQSFFWLHLTSNSSRIVILRSETPPTVGDSYFNAAKIGTLYIPSAYRAAYEAHSVWGRLSAKMADLEGSAYEVFNEWEYD